MNCRNIVCLSAVVFALHLNGAAVATTRYVSANGAGQYTLPSQAVGAAESGDTILIGPGTYTEQSDLWADKRLTWIGAGWDETHLSFNGNLFVWGSNANGTTFEGIFLASSTTDFGSPYYGSFGPTGGCDSVNYRRCVIKSYSASVISSRYNPSPGSWDGGRFYVDDCVLISANSRPIAGVTTGAVFRNTAFANFSTGPAISGISSGIVELYNCVFLNSNTVFDLSSGSQPVIAINNVFYDWGASPSFGTYPAGSTFDYNASENVPAPGTNPFDIFTNPFVNYSSTDNYQHGISDLHLALGSALIDAGHPSLLDLDNSRSDFGIYGGPRPLIDNGVPNYPWVVNIILSPNLVGQGTNVNATATGRVGPQY